MDGEEGSDDGDYETEEEEEVEEEEEEQEEDEDEGNSLNLIHFLVNNFSSPGSFFPLSDV